MSQPWTSLSRSALAAAFGTAARLRGGRPLHPSGLVFDAHLRLHGTARRWGAPFLDEPMELRGMARLSRSIGVPWPLPDILGIAFRWQQAGATAELLLATTGRSALGRRLLRPATRWTGLYTSLFPYRTGERRLLLGALLHAPVPVPATFDALTRAVAAGPLTLELLAADPSGPWQLLGQARLFAPASPDADRPTRFNPLRHPVPGLRPAGWPNEVRDAAYTAAQRVPDAGTDDRPAYDTEYSQPVREGTSHA
ncbi:hypothetical protein [Nonomuraea gerenzanensis]|uniref:Putative phosphodiesterase n=1 Tax=Nonomuraea gerenzanensis TaxID=93944 RepID=A0A1M4EE25_9ACTN|nr:hypothetical protein [Nonomuraea gerenzanensis]UBU08774.1 hypothetical protein LCN96_30805 [Nonomuraea gerenzanensis]SBO97139.1 putative phosphodiesterase [Nonomuraea gerenzanensis]